MDDATGVVGLVAGGQAIPLEGVSVEALIKEFCARVTLTQRYRNREVVPIEAVYVFPLDEGATVCGFEAIIDGTHVVGAVQKRDQAFETYDEALQAGHGAYLLDEERPDVFTASIGNLPPGAEVLIRITTVAELALEGDDIRFTVPTTVSPRYAPAEDQRGVGRSAAAAVNPPVAWAVPYGLDLTVVLEMASAIRGIESPSHPIAVDLEGHRGTVRLSAREAALDRDVVLLVRRVPVAEPHSVVEVDEDGRHVALVSFQPRFDDQAVVAAEIIFLVDRSGSMGGTSIAEARNALQLCLRSLCVGTRFNIVGFGSRFEMLFPESRPYDEAALATASAHVTAMEADLGGTEILAPLQAIFGTAPCAGVARQLVVLTDGQVSNTDAVIALVREHAATARVFSFGIGAGSSHHLVRGLARTGGGAAEFIAPHERIEAKVVRQLRKILSSALTEVRIDWGALEAKQAPHQVPPVFAGGRVLVYGFLAGGASGEVALHATGPTGAVSFRVPVDTASARAGRLLATLAARAMIRDLEEGGSALHERGGSLQRGRRDERVKEEIVRLGVVYQLVSHETSFVAVEHRGTPVEGEAQLRRVPVALTSGWGGWAGTSPAPLADVYPAPPGLNCLESSLSFSVEDPRRLSARRLRSPARLDAVDRARSSAVRPLDRLVMLQHADGFWELTDAFAAIVGEPLAGLEAALPNTGRAGTQARRVWATALALAYLQVRAADHRDEWVLLAQKARQWLAGCAATADGGDWVERATRLLSAATDSNSSDTR